MNTPRLRRGGGGVASSSFIIFLPVLVFLSTSYILFVTQLPSLERWALLPFLGFSYPNLLLVFLNLLFLGTCIICFSQVLDFLWVFFILFYFSVPYFGLACDHGNSFLCLEG